jgi:hypothetical protein
MDTILTCLRPITVVHFHNMRNLLGVLNNPPQTIVFHRNVLSKHPLTFDNCSRVRHLVRLNLNIGEVLRQFFRMNDILITSALPGELQD